MTTKTRKSGSNGKAQKTQALVGSLGGVKLLGEIVTFGSRSGSTHRYADVVAALTHAGLDPKAAKEFLPAQAFGRAAKKLAEARVIDVVNEHGDELVFQLTRKDRLQDEVVYTREAYVTLNRSTGKVTSKDPALQKRAQELLDAAMEERTTSDVTRIVMGLFHAHADLLPIPGAIGVFFVPAEHGGFVRQVETFLGALGRSPHSFPVPAGVGGSDAQVQTTVAQAMQALVDEHLQAIEGFSVTTRAKTLEEQAAEISRSRVKVEAYAHYLAERRDELLAALDGAQQRLADKVASLTGEKTEAAKDATPRVKLFAFSIGLILRRMGRDGWTFEQAVTALAGEGVFPDEKTVRVRMAEGRRGGEVACLTPEQEARLKAHLSR